MCRSSRIFGLVAILVLSAAMMSPCFAQVITGSPGAAFQTWTTADVNNNGAPYWDNSSLDGTPPGNIGACLSSTCGGLLIPGPSPDAAIPFWGMGFDAGTDSGGAADPNFFFNSCAPVKKVATLEARFAGAPSTEFGWFQTNRKGTTVIGPLHVLFTGSDPPGTTVTFTPTAFFGFFAINPGGCQFNTISSLSPCVPGEQHFAVFATSPGSSSSDLWVGVEDAPFASSDKDYQDVLVKISAAP